MKANVRTKTIEEIVNYEAFDGCCFDTEEECLKYEQSAFGVAKVNALRLRNKEMTEYSVFEYTGSDCNNVMVFDIRDADALQIVNTYLHSISNYCTGLIDPNYIGHTVAVLFGECEDWYCVMGTQEEMLATLTKNITKLFDTTKEG